mmetsp:Transcript_28748/g.63310  ORF Transcript_28748/g.63310 Transcript_28748/m.63310 type:complete len:462 (+) Transcript_28748:200-1585(+)
MGIVDYLPSWRGKSSSNPSSVSKGRHSGTAMDAHGLGVQDKAIRKDHHHERSLRLSLRDNDVPVRTSPSKQGPIRRSTRNKMSVGGSSASARMALEFSAEKYPAAAASPQYGYTTGNESDACIHELVLMPGSPHARNSLGSNGPLAEAGSLDATSPDLAPALNTSDDDCFAETQVAWDHDLGALSYDGLGSDEAKDQEEDESPEDEGEELARAAAMFREGMPAALVAAAYPRVVARFGLDGVRVCTAADAAALGISNAVLRVSAATQTNAAAKANWQTAAAAGAGAGASPRGPCQVLVVVGPPGSSQKERLASFLAHRWFTQPYWKSAGDGCSFEGYDASVHDVVVMPDWTPDQSAIRDFHNLISGAHMRVHVGGGKVEEMACTQFIITSESWPHHWSHAEADALCSCVTELVVLEPGVISRYRWASEHGSWRPVEFPADPSSPPQPPSRGFHPSLEAVWR